METNTEVINTGEPITKTGSSSDIVSFDELEAMTDTKAPRHEDKVSKPKSAKRKGSEDDEHYENEDTSGKKVEDPDESLDDDDKQKVEDKNKKAADKNKEPGKAKVHKFKSGDADLDVPGDAKVTVAVNGKNEIVDVQELINNYSGKQNFGRLAQELDTEKKSFHAERQALQTSVDDLYNLCVKENKPMDAVAHLTDLLGGNGAEVVKKMQAEMRKVFEEWSKLSPEERRIRETQEESELYKAKLARRDNADAKRNESAKIATRVQDVKTKYKISDAEFAEVYDTLKKGGQIKSDDLTPELIGEVHQNWQRMDRVDEIVAELGFDTEVAAKATKQLMNEWSKDKTLTKAQIKAIAESVFGKSSKKSASKLSDKLRRSGAEPKANADAEKHKNEPITFDDL